MEHFYLANFLEWRLSSYFARYASRLGLLETTRWHHKPDSFDHLAFGGAIRELGTDMREYLDTLSIAQHYDVPTRLLDFSFNPVKALSFAVFRPTPVAAAVPCVYALNVHDIPYASLDGVSQFDQSWCKFIAPHKSNQHIFAQEGLFLTQISPRLHYEYYGYFPRLEDDYSGSSDALLFRLRLVGKTLVEDLKAMLIRLQCTPADLMPSLSRCASAAEELLKIVVTTEHGPGGVQP